MAGVFISYRREDSIAYAGRIYDRLASRFGQKNVFMDVDTLKPGDDFIDTLQRTVASCDVLIAVIGKSWLLIEDQHGGKRLDDAADFVRLEVATALDRGIRVIPALVAGASMPTADQLPEALKKLARRQAVVLSDISFNDSIRHLLEATELKRADRRIKKFAWVAAVVVCALLIAGGSWYLWLKKSANHTLQESAEAFSVQELARLYNFPLSLNGRGQKIGFIELAGGYLDSDLARYWSDSKVGPPGVVDVSVDRAANSPGTDSDSAATLNIEVAGAVAPGAQIVLYFAPNSNAGFIHAIQAAAKDETHRPDVLVITWGAPESGWNSAARAELDRALKAVAERQITVVVAGGDLGVTDGVKDEKEHVDFPASSPWVLACGGTRLITAPSHDAIQNEIFLDAGGRGISAAFAKPDWQRALNVTGRAIPDIVADATSRYRVYLHGRYIALGGTSATASLWGGLLALINQGLGHNVGFINPILYQKLGPAGVLRSIPVRSSGFDKVQGCQPAGGWNACTGWGSPDGQKLLAALK